MHLEYNGVHLIMSDLIEYQREGVYSRDGADLMYVRHTLNVVCTLAPTGYPDSTSIALQNPVIDGNSSLLGTSTELAGKQMLVTGARGRDPYPYEFRDRAHEDLASRTGVGNISNSAFITDAEVRFRLMQPRKKLKITAWRALGDGAEEIVWLESPRPIVVEVASSQGIKGISPHPPCDAANGPIPLRVDVVDMAGTGASMGINFQISTCLVPVAPEAERLVLSHRWQVSHGQDEEHYLTRTTDGEIVFNGGMYRQQDLVPSDFLSQLFHPIPLGFQRTVPSIVQSSDGLVIQYTVQDHDTSITFDAGNSGVTGMNIIESLNYIQPSSWLGNRT